ncbi:YbaY family lipoprotein [Knoellia locipacati]|uniref:YbaY family lipoprotein n=1 Tax=Knoellia locipacati TaxID=882824 RepID=UPI003850D952
MTTVHVQIEWPEGIALPAGACARVSVEDVSALDAAATVVGETVLEELDPSGPTRAAVEVDDVDPGADLVVRVHVTQRPGQGRQVEVGDLITTQSHPVLTRGHDSSVVVRPRLVGG